MTGEMVAGRYRMGEAIGTGGMAEVFEAMDERLGRPVAVKLLRKPPILVYEHRGNTWQLGAFEWVFTSKPAKPPLPGAQYGVFGAACHYDDGTFVFASSQSQCAARSPQTGSPFNFWHPRLITLHLWLWYPNPSGTYTGTNPLASQFNRG